MKRIFKRTMYRSPELTLALGCMVVYFSASPNDFGTLYGNGAPEWTWKGIFAGIAILGISALLARVREAANRSKNR